MSGRPPKATVDEKKNIIIKYWIMVAECKPEKMRNANIKSKLAAFAKEHGIAPKNGGVFLSTDFKETACAKYIDELCATKNDNECAVSTSVFVPMDIDRALKLSSRNLREYLQDRDAYYETQHKKACFAIENYQSLSLQNKELVGEIEVLKGKIESYEKNIQIIDDELSRLRKDNEYFLRVIKKKVDPMLAEQYMKDAPNVYSPSKQLLEIADFNIEKAIKKDKQLHVAIKDIGEYF